MTSTYRSMQVDEAGGPFRLVEKATPEPGPGQVRIAVEASGICHSDAMFTSGHYPGATFPLVSGHEIAGRVDAIGVGVEGFEVG
jgi:alcohol dehydrogenase